MKTINIKFLKDKKWNIKKRMLSVIMCITFIVVLTACNKSNTDNYEVNDVEVSSDEIASVDEGNMTENEVVDVVEDEQNQEVQVKTFTEEELTFRMYQFVCQEGYGDTQYWDYCVQDDKGNFIIGFIYEDGKTESNYDYSYNWEYDENGRLINEKYSYFDNGKRRDSQELQFEYDGNGNIVKGNKYGGGGFYGVLEYEYDENRNIIKRTEYDSQGIVLWWDEFKYDENRNLIKEENYEYDRLNGWYEYIYDEQNRLVEEISYYSDGSRSYETSYTYDEQGRLIREHRYVVNLNHITESYVYDDQGNMVQKFIPKGTIDYEYDEQGRMLKYVYTSSSEKENVDRPWNEYEYDNDGRRDKILYVDNEGAYRMRKYIYDESGKLVDFESTQLR